jgi:adenylyl- and sulfurtransferase ThiI
MPQAISHIRRIGLEFARKRRFKGVVFADVRGSIAFDSSINKRSRELGVPVFRPLIGLDEADLSKLGKLLGVDWRNFADVSVESAPSIDSVDLSTLPITEVSL